MFKRYSITLGRVHDRVRITEGDERLDLRIDADPMRLVAGLSQAQKNLQAINKDSTEEDQLKAAEYFAQTIFGKDQAAELVEFYHSDAGCIINVCGKYFEERLAKIITKAQKKQK